MYILSQQRFFKNKVVHFFFIRCIICI